MTKPQPGLRERKRRRTIETISDTAITLFLDAGYDHVSVAEVAAAAEVSKPTLFRYFPSKEDLVLHRFADHEDEAARVVRGRPAGEAPLDALRRHFLAALDARDPVTGLCDHPQVLAFHQLLYSTPSLVARLHAYTTRSEEALAGALREVLPGGAHAELTARLAAGQIVTAQRILALDNWRCVADGGMTAAQAHPAAVAAAEHAFGLLGDGLADLR
ncbi:TetR/AcrR family transcriptional regulator [Streptomyces sp. LX-29]|uniref:TetR/AcrR family transcriptional regulator n=1 Tax=Streptomyces sp. LX-29 TaxID=2900152 RepID=UPI00240D7434|nr:TetR/AcrR family transcriptional regulator [Streptomyces sp. LX-29]WFB06214.1 TetR/AcrR family transcriptional regulator [Streptomyces sp. LX-29]